MIAAVVDLLELRVRVALLGEGISILVAMILGICDNFLLRLKLGGREGVWN